MMMKEIVLPKHYNYVGVFLALNCNLSCSYCINHLVGLKSGRKLLSGDEWVRALNRLSLRDDLPISLQGGEPSIHKDFYQILKGIKSESHIDILTNLQFDPKELARHITPERLNRKAPYAPIRVSYHPETMDLNETLEKVLELISLGFHVGVYGVLHPKYEKEILSAGEVFKDYGIDYRTKEFLGTYNGKLYGNYAYPESVAAKRLKNCECKTTELLIAPNGLVYRCHHDLYNAINPIGDILDENFQIEDIYRPCPYFGNCNPCDVKVKTNRFQKYGHTSVSIKDIREKEEEKSTALV